MKGIKKVLSVVAVLSVWMGPLASRVQAVSWTNTAGGTYSDGSNPSSPVGWVLKS